MSLFSQSALPDAVPALPAPKLPGASSLVPAAAADSSVFSWLQQHWLFALLLALAALILLMTVVLPLAFKIARRGKTAVETNELRKDLMVWRNLANLVQGGEKALAAKRRLSGRLGLIRLQFRQGLDLLKNARRRKYDLPWFVAVGEPRGGKSELFANSGLELICTTKPSDGNGEDDRGGSAFPLRCWLGARAFVLDVSGRVFFDRWLEGSSAEWNFLARLICRQHGKRPLDGVILVIPADALIADDETLTKRKASLISSELDALLARVGMNLPCHVVISKADMLLGFREYFSALNEEQSWKIFGWQNPSEDGKFRADGFRAYWTGMTEKLRAGSFAPMMRAEFFCSREAADARADDTGKIFLFPESFAALRKNLEIYLSGIFGEEGWHGNDQAKLAGVFVTSARDGGVVLSEAFASLRGARTEEAPIALSPLPEQRAFFIRRLLHDFVFPRRVRASFTARELFRRRVPVYALSLLMALIGAGWIAAAFFRDDSFRERLAPIAEYYARIAKHFAAGDIGASPLVGLSGDENPELLIDAEMHGEPRFTRLQFFYDARNRAEQKIAPPFGFTLSALLNFGPRMNLGYADRQYVFNQVQTEMVYLPTVRAMQTWALSTDYDGFDALEREAMFDFAGISFSVNPRFGEATPVDSFLRYMFPDISPDLSRLMMSYNREFDSSSADVAAKIVYEYDYAQAQKKWFEEFFDEWRALSIYPETLYPRMREILRAGLDFNRAQEKILALAEEQPASFAEAGTLLGAWEKLSAAQKKDMAELDASLEKISEIDAAENSVTARGRSRSAYTLDFLRAAVGDYERRSAADEEEFLSYLDVGSKARDEHGRALFFRMDPATARAFFSRVRESLGRELAGLREQGEVLRERRLFAAAKPAPADGKNAVPAKELDDGRMVIDVVAELGRISSGLGNVPAPESVVGFSSAWDELNARIARSLDEYDAFAKAYAENKNVAPSASALRRLLLLRAEYERAKLARELLAFFPKTETEFSAAVSALADPATKPLGVSPALAEESLGIVSVPTRYDPDALMKFLAPYATMFDFFRDAEKKKPSAGGAAESVFSTEAFAETGKMLSEYLENYLEFWGGRANSLRRDVKTWEDFRRFCADVRSYEVNTLLFDAYKNSRVALSRVPASLLSERQLKLRQEMSVALNDKISILNPHFSEICVRQTTEWSLLPADPAKAFRLLRETSEKDLLVNYFAVVAENSKADIPWWSALFRSGVEVLEKDAAAQIAASLSRSGDVFLFPLCADTLREGSLSVERLKEVSDAMAAVGFAGGGNKPAAPAKPGVPAPGHVLDAIRLDGVMSKEDSDWCARLAQIAEALSNRAKPTLWTLSLPDGATREKLNEAFFSSLPSATVRCRYAELSVDGKLAAPRTLLDAPEATMLARGNAEDADLELRLYEFSDASVPAASVRIPGAWAVLRVYLTKGGVFDPEKKILYAPLIVRDGLDAKSVLWLAVQFNKILPTPEEWPSAENWPEFSAEQESARERRIRSVGSWAKLFEESENYDALKKTLTESDLPFYPEVEIALDAASDGNAAFFLENRYAELVLPGEAPRRFSVGGNAVALGRAALTCPNLKIRFYRHSSDETPHAEVEISGPCAPLRLLTLPGRSRDGDAIRAELPVPADGKFAAVPLLLRAAE